VGPLGGPVNPIEMAAARAAAKWRADEKLKKLGKDLSDPKSHEKLAEAIAERLRLEKP